jgi:shikimate dehydrogenase
VAAIVSAPDRYAVFGHPVQHSLSPLIHGMFARATDQHLTYEKIEVRPEAFAATVKQFFATGGKGLNITVPHKQAAFALLATATPRAQLAASVNTLRHDASGLWGDNTDGAGLIADLTGNLRLTLQGARILLIGAGGAAHGVVGPLLEAQPSLLEITNRHAARAIALAEHFSAHGEVHGCGFDAISPDAFDLVINATSASLQAEFPAVSSQIIGPATFCYDMAYGHGDTTFTSWAKAHGATHAATGVGMLVEQAAEAFYLWRGIRPATAPVLEALTKRTAS